MLIRTYQNTLKSRRNHGHIPGKGILCDFAEVCLRESLIGIIGDAAGHELCHKVDISKGHPENHR